MKEININQAKQHYVLERGDKVIVRGDKIYTTCPNCTYVTVTRLPLKKYEERKGEG